jgi:tRNA U34 5-carboxymethylaminomethyl modifying enzyme MnmG/GidA
MNAKSLLFAAIVLIGTMFVYFLLNPSYEKSLEAKYYYETQDYKEAYLKANEAFSLDQYNRMASTIMAQSKIAMQYEKYIREAKKYMQEINTIASKEHISDADRARIKLMSEIMTDSYVKLSPSVITNLTLVQEAREYYESFEKLLEKVH